MVADDLVVQHKSEAQRLRALAEYRLVDGSGSALMPSTGGDSLDAATADDITAVTRLASVVTGLPIAALNIFDADRQVQLSAVGAPPSTSPRADSPCATHFKDGRLVHVVDASLDPRFASNAYVDGRLAAMKAYASAPLVNAEGYALGTLCVASFEPRELTEAQLTALSDLSFVVLSLFERRRQARISALLAAEAEEQRQLTELLMVDAARRSQLLEAVFGSVGVGLVVADADGLLVTTNDAADRLLGRSFHASPPLDQQAEAYDVRTADGVTRMATEALPVRRALDEGSVDGIEMVIVSPQGFQRAVVCSARPLHDLDGTTTGAVVALHDVSALHAREAALQEAHAQLGRHADQAAAVARAAHAVTVAEDPQRAICDAVRELTGADAALLMQPIDGRLVITAGSGIDEATATTIALTAPVVGAGRDDPSGTDLSRTDPSGSDLSGGSLTATAFASGEFLFVPTVADDPRHNAALSAAVDVVSGAWQPIAVQEGRSIGVLVVIWNHQVAEVTPAERAMLSALADAAAHAIERAELTEELEKAADHDSLTGLANRRSWDRDADREIARAGRTGAPLTFLLVDLDHFKRYNDTRGHLAGDGLLRAFARAAADCLREVDVIARWGGEEFAVALPSCSANDAVMVADRIRACVPDGQTATIGVAPWRPGDTSDQVLTRADAALYRGKQGGRNTTVVEAAPVLSAKSPAVAAV